MTERADITIRKYQNSDRHNVISLIEDSSLTRGHAAGFLLGILERRKILIADTGGNVVGTVIIDGPNKNQQSDIDYVVVHENFRRMGIGKILVTHAEQILRHMGVKKINLIAHQAKPHLINFYQNLGFVLVNADGSMKKKLR